MTTQLPPQTPTPEPRLRVKISDVAWGVFIGLVAWSAFAFIALIFLGVLGAAL